MKKIPLRTCVVSKEKCDKRDLLRVVRDKDGNVFVDLTLKANGHGVYLKKDANIIKTAKDKDILSRCLSVKVNEEVYDELLKNI